MTATVSEEGRIAIIVSKKEPRVESNSIQAVEGASQEEEIRGQDIETAEERLTRIGAGSKKIPTGLTASVVEVPMYIGSVISTLLKEYTKRDYKVDIREVQEEKSQGTASIIAQSIVTSDRSILPTITDIQRRVTKTQAYVEQAQAYIQKASKRREKGA